MKNEQKQLLVKELYEKYPYPSREFTSKEDLKYFVKWITKIFDEDTHYWNEKEVLELGCGTGELACGLALVGAKVTAIDLSSNSIKKAKDLSQKFKIENKVNFLEKNILKIKENEFGKKFDVVLALGSLHHTINAKKAFELGTNQLKENGIVIIGLYNKYSRLRHRLKRIVIRVLAGEDIEKRINIGEKLFGSNGKRIHSADKYGQVHESYHSISEITNWFRKEKITFLASKPKFSTPRVDELNWLINKKEAFFVMVGKKEHNPTKK